MPKDIVAQVVDSLPFSKHSCAVQSYLHSFCTFCVYVLPSLPWAAIETKIAQAHRPSRRWHHEDSP